MKIGQKFNTFSKKEYFFYIDNYRKYTDFNSLGLYRSIIENEKLLLVDKIEIREYAHKTFKKFFDFLQIKDPNTYFSITTLGQTLTEADEHQLWENIWYYQHKILSKKRIKHRNFGDYSKHNCGYETCPLNGLMIRQGSPIEERNIVFSSDHRNPFTAKDKSDRNKVNRKRERQVIQAQLEKE
ncbi:hypothetical protein [Spirosoma sp. KUDC1026]|uniref:hypothetical protein n=1 Tax=Spirosoma sp. KUDC1026 TaxID=2745947 RepID=UPI00159BE38D|nr:hypothetical protein [Spirosoma sp. KUDC1026]QKZ14082.1 hypothetical protein HU175_16175 [Spirosoma sp. KUDC1026]